MQKTLDVFGFPRTLEKHMFNFLFRNDGSCWNFWKIVHSILHLENPKMPKAYLGFWIFYLEYWIFIECLVTVAVAIAVAAILIRAHRIQYIKHYRSIYRGVTS